MTKNIRQSTQKHEPDHVEVLACTNPTPIPIFEKKFSKNEFLSITPCQSTGEGSWEIFGKIFENKKNKSPAAVFLNKDAMERKADRFGQAARGEAPEGFRVNKKINSKRQRIRSTKKNEEERMPGGLVTTLQKCIDRGGIIYANIDIFHINRLCTSCTSQVCLFLKG